MVWKWFYNLPIRRKQLAALFTSEVISIVGLVGTGCILIINSGRSLLVNQAKSELAVTEINYNIKINQMGFGFRGQSDNLAIISATQKYSQSQKLSLDLQQEIKKILQNEIKARKIEYATLVGRDLRNFSRLGEAECKLADIHSGIDSTLMILSHRLKVQPHRSAIALNKEYADLPLIECYPGQLNQVFMNILSNAIDALEEVIETNPIQPQIHIHTQQITPEAIIIRIIDNALGIPETQLAKIFDPFFTTKPVSKGTGLGLSISYKIIVEKHHGQLQCLSTPGKGTEFIIQIPITQKSRALV